VPTNKQRRDAARRHLERQLQRRQQREASRKRTTLIATIAGTVVLAVVVAVVVIALTNDNKKANANATTTPTPSATPSATPSPTPSTSYPPAKGAAVSFQGVTVKGAADLAGAPGVTSKSAKAPTKLEYKDLVVGKGKAATPTSTVQYSGVLYKTGTAFDSSWSRGQPAQFPLNGVVKGFTQGIAGTTGVPPMKIGGRRLIIMPASLGYGAQAQGPIPANSPLAFVVDLKSVTSAG
jgi:FKBP-type peptidyl-prolyl cis-trans isomerase